MFKTLALVFVSLVFVSDTAWSQCFIRGDANCDGKVEVADSLYSLTWLFLKGEAPCCLDAADSDDDGRVNISDSIVSLNWLFHGAQAPVAPGPFECGLDRTDDDLECSSYPLCVNQEACDIQSQRLLMAEIPDRVMIRGGNFSVTPEIIEGDHLKGIEFQLIEHPEGMSIDPLTGLIKWSIPFELPPQIFGITVSARSSIGASDIQSFNLIVRIANSEPEAENDAFRVLFGESLEIQAPGILKNDTDPNGDPLEAILVEPPRNGELQLNQDGSFTYTPSLLIPKVRENLNLSLLLFTEATAGTTWGPTFSVENATDNDPGTSWSASSVGENYFELSFEQDVTVRSVEIIGPRNNSGPFEGRLIKANIIILNRDDVPMLTHAGLEFDEFGDASVQLGELQGAAKVRIDPIEANQNIATFGELHVFGDAVPERLATKVEWTWEGSEVEPESIQAMATPLVADLDLDGKPEVIFSTSSSTSVFAELPGHIRVLEGDGGKEVFTITNPEHMVQASAQLAIGDITGDRNLEILALSSDKRFILAFTHSGELLWKSDRLPGAGPRFGGPTIANLDQDFRPEILVTTLNPPTTSAMDSQGKILWTTPGAGGGLLAGMATAADIDLDGDVEVVVGNTVLSHEGELVFKAEGVRDGTQAIGNLDSDPFPEIVVSYGPTLFLVDHDGSLLWEIFRPASSQFGAPPTIADFDGDGKAEIGLAAQRSYTVFEADGSELWSRETVDLSSAATGSTVFDFDNDGSPEVVYSDELWLWVFRGADGEVLLKTELRSGTVVEYPVVADIDNDGHAEIVAVANQIVVGGEQHGLWVFGGQFDDWVRARPIWNQHDYHVTNVNNDGSIPQKERPFWIQPGLNAFRQNTFLPEDLTRADRFIYRAFDGRTESENATVYLEDLPINSAPEFQSVPSIYASVGFPYVHAVQAIDPDQDPISISLIEPPEGMTFDPELGILRWSPSEVGEFFLTIRVQDDKGFESFQRALITVREPRVVPNVLGETETDAANKLHFAGWEHKVDRSKHHRTAEIGTVIEQRPIAGTAVEFFDIDVHLTLSLGPDPFDVDDDGDGFTENEGDCNDSEKSIFPGAVEIRDDQIDQDCDGDDASLGFFEIVVTPVEVRTIVGRDVELTALALQNDGTVRRVDGLVTWESGDNSIVEVDSEGLAKTISPGRTRISATLEGITGSMAIWVVSPAQVTDRIPPRADITFPLPGTTHQSVIDIKGFASDQNFVRYLLQIAPMGSESYVELARGTEPIVDGTLGFLDPTTLQPNSYHLLLTVEDAAGHSSTSTVPITIEEGFSVGQFSLSFLDLRVPTHGIPIEVIRTYETRDKSQGDFGIGWKFAYNTIRINPNRVLGDGWVGVKSGLAFGIVPAGEHKVSVYLPGGRVEVFDLEPQPSATVLRESLFIIPQFIPRPGTRGSLKSLRFRDHLLSTGGVGNLSLIDTTTGSSFDPQLFLYTDADGTEIEIHSVDGVRRIRGPNGNEVTLTADGIEHSSGLKVNFERDVQGRITRITDTLGVEQKYEYSIQGNLVKHIDRSGESTQFKYDQRSNLIEIIGAGESNVTRYEYDDLGRLVTIVDSNGNRTEVDHDTEGQKETLSSQDGFERTYEYDDRGNILSETDALGNVTRFTYDAANRLTQETYPSGLTVDREYNEFGDLISVQQANGSIIEYEYNEMGKIVTKTEAGDITTQFSYDAFGNLTSMTDALGNISKRAYDSNGNLIRTQDPKGNIETFEYDEFGRMTRHVDAVGSERLHLYDANGNLLSTSVVRGSAEEPIVDTFELEYDSGGHLSQLMGPNGNQISFEYDALGNRSAVVLDDGTRTEIASRHDSQVKRIRFTDDEEFAFHYSPGNQLEGMTLPTGETQRWIYDEARRPAGIIYPDGDDDPTNNLQLNVELNTDGLVSSLDIPGQGILQISRNEQGEVQTISNSESGDLHLVTNHRGQVTQATDADGRVQKFEYDDLGRVIRSIHPDGTEELVTYNELGQVSSIEDNDGVKNRFTYDPYGKVTSVINRLGQRTQYEYTSKGLLQRQVDALGRETHYDYDSYDRLTAMEKPSGSQMEIEYDSVGLILSKKSFNDEVIHYVYDSRHRLIEKTFPDESKINYEYNLVGQVISETSEADHRRYSYDAMGRLLSRTEPDGRKIAYEWNDKGYLASVEISSGVIQYQYSDSGLLEVVVDVDGGMTRYRYDSANRLVETTFPNNFRERKEFNNKGQLLRIESLSDQNEVLDSWIYSYNSIGQIVSVLELNGRTVNWEYDSLGRLISEMSSAPDDDRQVQLTYDAVGNVILREDSNEGMTSYLYDDEDRLIESNKEGVRTDYTYDSAGRLIHILSPDKEEQYIWDAENRLIQHTIHTEEETTIEYQYDSKGLMVSRSVNGEETRFLVDTLQPFAQIVEETDTEGNVLAVNTWGAGGLAQVKNSAGTLMPFKDGHSGIRSYRSDSGELSISSTWDAWGNRISPEASSLPYGYRGERVDLVSNSIYLRQRHLNPKLGRFISPDPFEGIPELPVSRHRYLYANNDPIHFIDPSGAFPTFGEVIVSLSVSAILLQIAAVAIDESHALDRIGWNGHMWSLAVTTDITKILSAGSGNGLAVLKPGFGTGVSLTGFTADSTCQGVKRTDASWLTFSAVAGAGFGFGASNGGFDLSSPGFLGPHWAALVGPSFMLSGTAAVGGFPNLGGIPLDQLQGGYSFMLWLTGLSRGWGPLSSIGEEGVALDLSAGASGGFTIPVRMGNVEACERE